jgi:hypothetical protein
MIRKFITLFFSSTLALGALAQGLVISEINYNPANQGAILGDDLEFIELSNITDNPINLSGFNFFSGIVYTFPAGVKIAPKSSLVLAKNKPVFDFYYGISAFAQYTGGLKNTGETITLNDNLLNQVFSVSYLDSSPWSSLADGLGYSLELVDPVSPNRPNSWAASQLLGGSPGSYKPSTKPVIFSVIVNEVLANGDANTLDEIELWNYSDTVVDISNWYLTDDKKNPQKYLIPNGTTIMPNSYLVFTSSYFGALFNLSAQGEDAYIYSANSQGLTGYSNGFTFDVSQLNQSFGRHLNSQNEVSYFVQQTNTFGAKNSKPVVGPLVITDISYAPDFALDEFVIIRNISDTAVFTNNVALSDSNGIKLDGISFSFDFTKPFYIAPQGSVILCSIDTAAFRAKYKIKPAFKIFQFTGNLSNTGECLSLRVPIYQNMLPNGAYQVAYQTMDQVCYKNQTPWPLNSDGRGTYLHRQVYNQYANDPLLWVDTNSPVLTIDKTTIVSNDLIIYPQPAANQIAVSVGLSGTTNYQVLDLMGQIVSKGSFDHEIPVSGLSSGVYILIISQENKWYTTKFVKE